MKYSRSDDALPGLWVLAGIAVRLAQHAGYHREAPHSAPISSLDAEMRRRTWTMVVQINQATSAQFGLPRMIIQTLNDAVEARILLVEVFDAHVAELLHARPDTDHTAIQFITMKNRVLVVLEMIFDLVNSKPASSYADIMRLDTVLTIPRTRYLTGYICVQCRSPSLTHPSLSFAGRV